MALEVGRLTRLKAAIDNTTTMQADAMSASALVNAASQYRAQVADALEGDLKIEFESLFPGTTPAPAARGLGAGGPLLAQASEAEKARATLLGISGWLAGLVRTGGQ